MLCTTDPKASQNGTQHHDAVAPNTGGTATCPVNSILQKYLIWGPVDWLQQYAGDQLMLGLWSLNASPYHRPLVTYFSCMINIINPKVNIVVQNSLLKCETYILLLGNSKILTNTLLGCIT